MYSAYKLNKQGENVQPWCTPFPVWNQSVVPCPVLTVAPDLHTDFSRGRSGGLVVPSLSIKSTTTTGGGGKGGKTERIYRTNQKIRIIIGFSWVTALIVPSCTGNNSPPHFPRMPYNTVLVSGPPVEAAEVLICSYSSVFLPPRSTGIRTSAFSFVEALSVLLSIPSTQSLRSWSSGFNLQLVQMVWRFCIFLSQTASGFQLWFYFHFCMWVVHWGLASEATLEALDLLLWGLRVEVV